MSRSVRMAASSRSAQSGTRASASFSPDARRVLTTSADGTARLWDAATGKPVGVPMVHHQFVWKARFSADGRRVVTAGMDQTARIWDAGTGLPVGLPLQHERQVDDAAFSPDGMQIVTTSWGGVRLWRVLLGTASGEHGSLLADLAEVTGSYRLNELGAFAALREDERRERAARIAGADARGFVTLDRLLRRFLSPR